MVSICKSPWCSQSNVESAIGPRVDHRELNWDSGFPDSHEFYYAQGGVGNVYIAHPRNAEVNSNGKRPQQGGSENTSPKKARHKFS